MKAALRQAKPFPEPQVSMWVDAPREGFSARCVDHFGVNFNGDRFIVNSGSITVTYPKPVTRPHGALTVTTPPLTSAQRRRNGVNGAGTMIAKRGLSKGQRLVG